MKTTTQNIVLCTLKMNKGERFIDLWDSHLYRADLALGWSASIRELKSIISFSLAILLLLIHVHGRLSVVLPMCSLSHWEHHFVFSPFPFSCWCCFSKLTKSFEEEPQGKLDFEMEQQKHLWESMEISSRIWEKGDNCGQNSNGNSVTR